MRTTAAALFSHAFSTFRGFKRGAIQVLTLARGRNVSALLPGNRRPTNNVLLGYVVQTSPTLHEVERQTAAGQVLFATRNSIIAENP